MVGRLPLNIKGNLFFSKFYSISLLTPSSSLPMLFLNSIVYFSSKYLNREVRFMKKLISKGQPKKKFFGYPAPETIYSGASVKTRKVVNTRRINVLNKIFMEHITSLLVTGNLDSDIVEKGIQITKVEVAPDFNNMNVFWSASLMDENIETILSDTAYKIRHELSQLKVIGTIPKITFIKDTKQERLNKVYQLIDKISNDNIIEYGSYSEDNEDFANCPGMMNNVYGLEHEKIMRKIGFEVSSKHQFCRTLKKFLEANESKNEDK